MSHSVGQPRFSPLRIHMEGKPEDSLQSARRDHRRAAFHEVTKRQRPCPSRGRLIGERRGAGQDDKAAAVVQRRSLTRRPRVRSNRTLIGRLCARGQIKTLCRRRGCLSLASLLRRLVVLFGVWSLDEEPVHQEPRGSGAPALLSFTDSRDEQDRVKECPAVLRTNVRTSTEDSGG